MKFKSLLPIIIAFAFIFPYKANAIPATPKPITVIQPDQSPLTLYIIGDEHFHYRTTTDGYPIQEAADGLYYYTAISPGGQAHLSTVKAHNPNDRSLAEQSFLSEINKKEIIKSLFNQNQTHCKSQAESEIFRLGSFPSEGEQPALVILVEFADIAFSSETPVADFSNLLNQQGYAVNGATGSVRDYFIDNSMAKFLPQFDVYGPVTLPNEVSFYGGNNDYGQDRNNRQMIVDACQVLHESGQIDFSEYDNDNDGIVDNIYIFYAGYAESDGGPSYTIWPHSWNLAELDINYDDVQLGTYACSSELINGQGNTMAPIGAFTHEFMHVLGLPDLYETNYYTQYCFAPGAYSVLGGGPYNNEQRTPPFMSAYERYYLNWLQPGEITGAANLHIPFIEGNQAYRIKTDNPDQYYILENRQLTGWDAYIPGHGMLVWYIDYDADIWAVNEVNNDPDRQRVDIIEADNIKTDVSRAGDTFPGAAGVTSLDIIKPLTQIIEADGVIHLKTMGGKDIEGKVDVLPASEITQTSFIANWKAFSGIYKYKLSVYSLNQESEPIYVAGFNNHEVGNDITELLIDNLNPETEYRYTVVAFDAYSQTELSDEVLVNTTEATFEYYVPIANVATNINEQSFTANWQALAEATAYYLTVYQKECSEAESTTILDFVDRLAGIPDDWTTNCTSTSSQEGYYGEAAYSLRMDIDGQYIESPVYPRGIFNLSFWHRSSTSNQANSLILYGYNGTQWLKIRTINPLANAAGGETITLDADELQGFSAIKIAFSKSATGYVVIDDIKLETGFEMQLTPLDGYNERNVGNLLSFDIDGLNENEYYYYTIGASNGSIYSRTSNEVRVFTEKGSAINNPSADNHVDVYVSNKSIHVQADDNKVHTLKLFDIIGRVIYSGSFSHSAIIPIEHMNSGIYLLQVDQNKGYKLRLDKTK